MLNFLNITPLTKNKYYENIKNSNFNFSGNLLNDKYELVFISLLFNLKITIYKSLSNSHDINLVSIFSSSEISQFNIETEDSNIKNILKKSYERKPININLGYISEENHYLGLQDRLDLLESTLAVEEFEGNKFFHINYNDINYALKSSEDTIPFKVIGYYDAETYKIEYLSEIQLKKILNKHTRGKKLLDIINNIIILQKQKIKPIVYYKDLVNDQIYIKNGTSYTTVGHFDILSKNGIIFN